MSASDRSASDLVVELGAEELPASFVRAALQALPALATELLAKARLPHAPIVSDARQGFGTPRRLALLVPALVAYDAEGKPTKATEAFIAKQGLKLEDLRITETEKGAYVCATRREQGRPTREVLPALLAELCRRIPFAKSMRWGENDTPFGRPLHWIVALHGGQTIDFDFAGISSGATTRGHRFLCPDTRALNHASEYVSVLREMQVVVAREERRAQMIEALHRAAASQGGEVVLDAFLLDECLDLVEQPKAIVGNFDPAYLRLPDEVILSVMRGHQRYFALRREGRLLPNYITVTNATGDETIVRQGNDRVMRARLADARFFVDEDRKVGLKGRAEALEALVFQAKLGSVAAKVERMKAFLAQAPLSSEADRQGAILAASLCKADLATAIVGEFPELQGEMGRWYALEEGIDAPVADALREHYWPRSAQDGLPNSALSSWLALADRLDTLVAFFGLGMTPSGSADPYALRRAALGVLRIGLEGPVDFDLRQLLSLVHDTFPSGLLADRETTLSSLESFFQTRLQGYLEEKVQQGPLQPASWDPELVAGFASRPRPSVIQACLAAWSWSSLKDLVRSIDALLVGFRSEEGRSDAAQLIASFKRVFNITREVESRPVDPALHLEVAEQALAKAFAEFEEALGRALERKDYPAAFRAVVATLSAPIDDYFQKVFVMVEDTKLRDNRLALLKAISERLAALAHFHLLQAEEVLDSPIRLASGSPS